MGPLSVGFWRQGLTLILALICGVLASNGLLGSSGLRDLLILRAHGSLLTSERDKLIGENAALRERIARLNFDDAYLQRLIRQELGYVLPGEFVYRFPKSEQP